GSLSCRERRRAVWRTRCRLGRRTERRSFFRPADIILSANCAQFSRRFTEKGWHDGLIAHQRATVRISGGLAPLVTVKLKLPPNGLTPREPVVVHRAFRSYVLQGHRFMKPSLFNASFRLSGAGRASMALRSEVTLMGASGQTAYVRPSTDHGLNVLLGSM